MSPFWLTLYHTSGSLFTWKQFTFQLLSVHFSSWANIVLYYRWHAYSATV